MGQRCPLQLKSARDGIPETGEGRKKIMKPKELNGEELVRALLLGSTEIDQMRKEIESFVNMIIGFLLENRGNTMSYHSSFSWKSNDGHIGGAWQVYRSQDRYLIELMLMGGHVYDSDQGARCIQRRAVRHVRMALGALADGINNISPSLNERWRPLLDAAAAK